MTIRHNTGLIENFRIAVEQKKTLETIPEVLSILILEYHALQSRRNTDFFYVHVSVSRALNKFWAQFVALKI